MKKIFPLILVIILIFITALSIFYMHSESPKPVTENTISQNAPIQNNFVNLETIKEKSTSTPKTIQAIIPTDTSITLAVTGDIMCHNTQFKDAFSNGVYDFSYVFSDIEKYLKSADIAIGNLETTFAGNGKPYDGYPAFNTPEALAYDLAEAGFDIITTSNNHSLDTGYNGLESTLNFLDDAGLSHIGTSRSIEEQITPLIKDVNGVKIAFLSYTYGTNGIPIPSGKEYCINLIDKDLILSHLNIAKAESPDIICVSMHWGEEYMLTPNDTQKELTDFLFENGVDIIFGNHPHVLQPLEHRNITLPDGTTKEGLVIYSLGNLISGQVKENTRTSSIITLKLTKKAAINKITFDEIIYTPIYTYTSPKYKNYKILDIQQTLYNFESKNNSNISNETYQLLQNELKKVNNLYLSY